MKSAIKFAVLVGALMLSASSAFAWNCSDPYASRVPVPSNTTGTYGSGDGQLFLGTGSEGVKGQLYQCQKPTNPPSPSAGNTSQNQNQSQNQSQNNSQNSTQNTSNQNVSSSGSSSKSNSNASSKSNSNAASQSNNSNSNINTLSPVLESSNSATGGTANSSSSATNNSSGNTSTYESNSTYTEVRQNPGAFAPTAFSTSPCTKGVSAGGSTPTVAGTFGIALTDKGCDSRQTAAVFYAIGNPTAAAQILCSTDASKRAKLTLAQCLTIVTPVQVAPPVAAPAPKPEVIVIPAPTPVAATSDPKPIAIPIEKIPTPTLVSLGGCPVTRLNVCNRELDQAFTYMARDPNAEVSIHGPLQTMPAFVSYVKQHGFSTSRVRIALDDVNTIDVGVWSAE